MRQSDFLRKEAAAAKPVPEFVPRKLSELSLGGSIDGNRPAMMQPPPQQQTNGAFNSHFNSSSQNPHLQQAPRNSHSSASSKSSYQPKNPTNQCPPHLASKSFNLIDGNFSFTNS